ncbi:MAG: mechanosensitive ion channel family protein [Asticcacaulis sp.]|nr:mechanosensitive ion channel family protein [Asticcacaulis sp.]
MTNAASALAILVITLFVARWVSNGTKNLARRFVQNDADRTLPLFLSQVVRWMILTLGFVAVMNRLGIETASFITVLGAASLSIGLALQGTLGNVAAGLMILFTKPYRIGDSVRVGEVQGRVRRLGLFNTEIDNIDNVRVYVPNSKIFANEISNVSTNGAVKVEVRVEVGYGTDLNQALNLLLDVARALPERMEAPEPWVALHDFGSSGIVVRIAVWVLPARLLPSRTQLIVDIKAALDAAGIDIPYPHQVSIEAKS